MTVSWTQSLNAFLHPRVLTMLFLGFSAGLPILLIFSTMSVWLMEANVTRSNIGFFSWAALGYAFKFVWAPLIDRLPLPLLTKLLGRRRSWLILAQCSIIAALILMGLTNPEEDLVMMAVWAIVLGFSSATQDIVIDAYRIEAANEELQGLMASTYIAGYRIGMLVAGAGALELAGLLDIIEGYDYRAWRWTYVTMAGFMLVGILTTLIIDEPATIADENKSANTSDYIGLAVAFVIAVCVFIAIFLATSSVAESTKTILIDSGWIKALAGFIVEGGRLIIAVLAAVIAGWLAILAGIAPRGIIKQAYLSPISDFFSRYGKTALLILALVATYRISDVVMGVMANVFYIDIGFEKQEIGRVTKGFGLIMTILGGLLGGLLILRFGMMRILLLGALLTAATNLLFVILDGMGSVLWMLVLVISGDNLSAGIASAVFVAYLSSLTDRSFTATQYALFSSMMLLLPKILAGYSGMIVDTIGYAPFFIFTASLGIPVLFLVMFATRVTPNS